MMSRSCVLVVAVLATQLANLRVSTTAAEQEVTDSALIETLNRSLALADQILERHIDPPTRQQMVLGMARALCEKTGGQIAPDFSRRLSSMVKAEEFLEVLTAHWGDVSQSKRLTLDELDAALTTGLLSTVPGTPFMESTKDHRVAKQFAENRYVGTGIYLGMRKGRPTMVEVFKDGPADRAGGRKGDVFEEIDGRNPAGLSLLEMIGLLRGPEGSKVMVVLRQPGEASARTCTITRGVVPIETVAYSSIANETGTPIAHLSVHSISASAVHELRKHAQRMAEEGVRGVILDLRGSGGRHVHHAVLLADALLDGGVIGRLRTRHGTQQFPANRDGLFKELPLAVLVGQYTSGPAEWLAAALQDNERALIVGERTAGYGYSNTAIPVPGRDALLWLPTGLLERGDGRSLLKPPISDFARPIAFPRVNAKLVKWGVSPDHYVPTVDRGSEDAALNKAVQLLRARFVRTLHEREF